jgi:antitoxin CptB
MGRKAVGKVPETSPSEPDAAVRGRAGEVRGGLPRGEDPGRLRWRCRRGTRELDLLLGWWLEDRWPHADAVQRAGFDTLLDAPDPDLWDWLIARIEPPDPAIRVIVHEIRARHRV